MGDTLKKHFYIQFQNYRNFGNSRHTFNIIFFLFSLAFQMNTNNLSPMKIQRVTLLKRIIIINENTAKKNLHWAQIVCIHLKGQGTRKK